MRPERRHAGHRLALVAVLLALAAGLAGSCDNETETTAVGGSARAGVGFDAPEAWRLIRLQLRYGQRPAGSSQLRRLAVELRDLMPEGRFERIPGEAGLRNIVAVVPGRLPALVIGAHYDTLTQPKGFVGANNGAAGTAIVVEVARTIANLERPPGSPEIRFVLFDGEEPPEGLPENQVDFYSTGLRGSRAYVRAHADQTGAMVLLDYVANRGLRLPREGSSSSSLWTQVRAAAEAVGAAEIFPPTTGVTITDDHTPFLRAGISAVDLIDWSYDGHALSDTLDKLSIESVDAVGETIVELVERTSAEAVGGG
jgi:glutaminyl-peptide cyclotransferase